MDPHPRKAGGPANLSQKFKPFLNRTDRGNAAGRRGKRFNSRLRG
ncbi:hypothetical protein [Azospirillum largimobile]